MKEDRDALFGLLAIQLQKIAAGQIEAFVSACTADSPRPLPERLVEAGIVSDADAQQLLEFVDAALQIHDQDPGAALGALCNVEQIHRIFGTDAPFALPSAKLVRGATLREAFQRARALADRLNLLPHFLDLCQIIALAHGRGVVHRNLHPGNVLISEWGETLVRDWSLSKTRGRQDPHAAQMEEAIRGLQTTEIRALHPVVDLDPGYLAPEAARGYMDAVDARSDVYALGAILYELLAGQAPCTGNSPGEVLASVASKKPVPIPALEPTAPAELIAVCERAMHQEPSARYSSAKQLTEDLRRVQTQPATTPQAREGVDRLAKYNLFLGVAAGVVTLLLGIAFFSYRGAVETRRAAVHAMEVEQQKRAVAEEARENLTQELEEAQRLRREAEADRDRVEAARVEAVAARETAEKALAEKTKILEKQEPAATTPVPGPQEPVPPAAVPSVPPGGFRAKRPPVLILPGTFPVLPEAAQRPILTKEELAKALPELAAALREEKGQGATKPDVLVGTAGKELSDALQRLGFKGGDVITNINRAAVESAEQARKALDNVKNDLGFTVRIVRDGQSTWMRINAVEARPPAPPEPSVEPAKPKPSSPNESPKVPPAESPAAEPAGSEPSSPDESPAPSPEEPPAESPVTEKDKG